VRYDRIVAHTPLHAVLAMLAAGTAAGYAPTLDRQAIEDAIAIGQSRIESVRVRFHQPYRIDVGRAPVDYVDVVTPFRRLELAVEERARLGERLFPQRDALSVVAEHGDRLELFVELTFHPQNTYVGVPAYTVTLTRAGRAPIEPLNVQRVPRFGSRFEGYPLPYPRPPLLPSGSDPMLGGTLVLSFSGKQLDPVGTYELMVEESGKALARIPVTLASVR